MPGPEPVDGATKSVLLDRLAAYTMSHHTSHSQSHDLLYSFQLPGSVRQFCVVS